MPTVNETAARRAALFNNAHYRVACMGDPALTVPLKKRYTNLAAAVVPAIESRVERIFHTEQMVEFIALLGSASVFKTFGDVDLTVGLKGNILPPEKIPLMIVDENDAQLRKIAEIFYYRTDRIGKKDYIRFIFSKPALCGQTPSLFQDKMPAMLSYATDEALFKAAENIGKGDYKRSDHLLMAALRHVFSLHTLGSTELPGSFRGLAASLLKMDEASTYEPGELHRIHSAIDQMKNRPFA